MCHVECIPSMSTCVQAGSLLGKLFGVISSFNVNVRDSYLSKVNGRIDSKMNVVVTAVAKLMMRGKHNDMQYAKETGC
jgi:hypothetical protein